MAKQPPASKVGAERARLFKSMAPNPISGLTPARLVSYLNAWKRGEIRQAALLWHDILERDDQAKPCASKRTRAVASLDWEILPIDDSNQALEQKKALEHFYNNLSARDGLNEMERGGIRQLIKQMMTAVGMRYAMHEIIWNPGAPGGLTAEFKFLPLQFFENTTGRLRFLESDSALYGKDLDEHFGAGGWMCNSGEGLMMATSIAYMFKTPAGLKAWVTWMEKYGVPPLHGKTSAAKDSPEWNELVSALNGFGEDLAIVTNEGASISPIEAKNAGNPPHPPLVERMDRAISRIWMGGDLATMSASGQAVGSNPQSDDLDQLKADDAAMITDALQYYVDRQVIAQLFGEGSPLAYFKLKPPVRFDVDRERATDTFLLNAGVPVGKKQLMARYNRAEPAPGDELAVAAPKAPGFIPGVNEVANPARQQIFRQQSLALLSRAQAEALSPLTDRLGEIIGIEDETAQDAALLKLQEDMPQLLSSIAADPQLLAAWEKILAAALTSGAAESAIKQSAQ